MLQEAARSIELLSSLGERAPLDAALACLDAPGVLDAPAGGPAGITSGRAVWEWATRERGDDASPGDSSFLRRWDTMGASVGLVATLAGHAAAGSSLHAAQAIEVIELTRRAGEQRLFVAAQQTVYDALLGRGRDADEALAHLGTALGLSVDAVTARRR